MPANYVVETIGSGGLTLKSLHTEFIYNGTVAHVIEINEDFFLDKSSSATPDDITVVQPTLGPGRWIRRVTTNLRGLTLSSTPPDDGYVLAWNENDGYWEPKSPSSVGVQLSGDLSGSSSSVTVVGLQGRSVASTAPTDGYVLGWVAASNQWEPIRGGAGFGASLKSYEVNFLSGIASVSETTYQTIGLVTLDVSKLAAAPEGGTRTIKLKITVQTSGTTAEVILYNLNTGLTVSLNGGSIMLSSNSTSPALLTSQDLSSLLTNGLASYEVRVRQTSSNGTTDSVICYMCKFDVEWTFPE
jgi:hypothetical protein